MFSSRADFTAEQLRRPGFLAARRPRRPGYKGGPNPCASSPLAHPSATFNQGWVQSSSVAERRKCLSYLNSGVTSGQWSGGASTGWSSCRVCEHPTPWTRKALDAEELVAGASRTAADLRLPRAALGSALPSVCNPPPCSPCSCQRVARLNLEFALDWVDRRLVQSAPPRRRLNGGGGEKPWDHELRSIQIWRSGAGGGGRGGPGARRRPPPPGGGGEKRWDHVLLRIHIGRSWLSHEIPIRSVRSRPLLR
jgi:hypothetical protein